MSNRRIQTRHNVMLNGTIVVRGQSYEISVENLSLGGAFIEFAERLPMGERVNLTFWIPTQETPIQVDSAVRWLDSGGFGVQFDGLRARDVWSLNKYFESID